MALADDIQVVAVNPLNGGVGETIAANAITVDGDLISGDGSGGTSSTDIAALTNGSSISAAAEATLGSFSAAGEVAFIGFAEADLSGGTAPDGDVEIYFEYSIDGGTSYHRSPTPIAILNFTGTAESKSVAISA
jgi:hypothetical protein